MYIYEGFRLYMRILPGYREFIHNLHREFDDHHYRRQEMRSDYDHGQQVLDYVRDEDDRIQAEWEQQQRIEEEERRE